MTSRIQVGKDLEQSRNILSKEQINKLYESCNDDLYGMRDRAIIAVFYGCGLRCREGANLEQRDIDFKSGLLHVRKGKGNGQPFFSVKTNLVIPSRTGLEQSDFITLETKDINLEKGTIYIPSRKERRSRILKFESNQVIQLQNFLFSLERTTEKAFSPYNDNPNHFNYLLRKLSQELKKQIKDKLEIEVVKLSHLRQSRITIWVKKEGIRKGQYKAGFRRVMSAEKYLKADLTDLKNEIKKHHPFK